MRPPSHRVAILAALAVALAVGCKDSTAPTPELSGIWKADSADFSEVLPIVVRSALPGSPQLFLSDLQLRFRTRGRVLDLRHFFSAVSPTATHQDDYDIGGAYAYHLLSGHRIAITRPINDTAYADTGMISGDTMRIFIRNLEPQYNILGSGRGRQFRFLKVEVPQ